MVADFLSVNVLSVFIWG